MPLSEDRLRSRRTGISIEAGFTRRLGVPTGGDDEIMNLRKSDVDGNTIWEIDSPRRLGHLIRPSCGAQRLPQLGENVMFGDHFGKTLRVLFPPGAIQLRLGLS